MSGVRVPLCPPLLLSALYEGFHLAANSKAGVYACATTLAIALVYLFFHRTGGSSDTRS